MNQPRDEQSRRMNEQRGQRRPKWKTQEEISQIVINKFREKERVFNTLLSLEERERWLHDYRQRLGEPGKSLGKSGIGLDLVYQMAIETWWRLGSFDM